MSFLAMITLWACASDPVITGDAPQQDVQEQPTTTHNLDDGQQHPPIPANNPVWSRNVGGFVPEFRWYGEHSWADVRMRVAGHLSAAGRDRARLAAQQGDFATAAQHYQRLVEILEAIPSQTAGTSGQINALLLAAAQRDAAWTAALAQGMAPEVPAEGLAAVRAHVLGLALRHRQGEDVSAPARQLQDQLEPYLVLRTDLDLDAFADFHARHALRIRLFEAYLDSLDPLGIEERWGYWEGQEVVRQARILGIALSAMGGDDVGQGTLVGEIPVLSGDPLLWPSQLADALHSPDQQPQFAPVEIGALPTGDTLIDTAGHPGPRAIGTLQTMGLDDPEHRPWLDEMVQQLNAAQGNPTAVVSITRAGVDELDAHGHGSRFYNIKQLRNAAVRQLAMAGAHAQALEILADNWPLHHQDWACPNRAGILHAVEGRLRAEQGDEQADAILAQSIEDGLAFLAQVDDAARRPPAGPPNGSGPNGGPSNGGAPTGAPLNGGRPPGSAGGPANPAPPR